MDYTATIYRSGRAVASNEADTWKALVSWARFTAAVNGDVLMISEYVGSDKKGTRYFDPFTKFVLENGEWVEKR